MEADRWQRMKTLFDEAMDLPKAERDEFVDTQLVDDEELALTLRRMLDAEQSPTEILASPAMNWLRGPAEDADALIGSRIGELRVDARIASGGMSNVYRASNDGSAKPVAIKVMRQGLDSAEARRRFELEARSLASLRHPNIVELLRTEILPDGRPGLVMELVEGESIERYCARPSLDPILALFLQLCAAVQHAHGKLWVHRDLKPANILVQADGQVKVLDFGIVKLLAPSEDDQGTRLGAMVPLTPRYASPEQRRGETVATSSDVYSLGVILDELLQRFALSSGHDLRRIIAKCRQEDAELRYGSVDLLAEDLGRYRRGEPIRIRSASMAYRLSKFVGRNRWSVGLSTLLLTGLLVTQFFLYGQLQATEDAENLAWRAHSQALRVAGFFETLVAASDPETLRGDLGAMAALEDASATVGEDMAEFPEAEGRVRMAIANLYAHLGRYEDAIPHAERALVLARGTRGFGGGAPAWIEGMLVEWRGKVGGEP